MSIFDEVLTAEENFILLSEEAHKQRGELGLLQAQIRERLKSEKEKDAVRIAELEKKLSDPSLLEVIKKLTTAEIEKIKKRKYVPSPEEAELFDQTLIECRKITEEAVKTQRDLIEKIREADAKLKEVRSSAFNRIDPDLLNKWINSIIDDYNLLKKV